MNMFDITRDGDRFTFRWAECLNKSEDRASRLVVVPVRHFVVLETHRLLQGRFSIDVSTTRKYSLFGVKIACMKTPLAVYSVIRKRRFGISRNQRSVRVGHVRTLILKGIL